MIWVRKQKSAANLTILSVSVSLVEAGYINRQFKNTDKSNFMKLGKSIDGFEVDNKKGVLQVNKINQKA